MDAEPSLSAENARLLDQAACSADILERRCITGLPFAQERDNTAMDIAATVDEDIQECRATIANILANPFLLPWMDGNDRNDLNSLSHDLRTDQSNRTRDLTDSNDPYPTLCRFFDNAHSTARMAALLIRATRGSLRHRLRTRPIYDPPEYKKDTIHMRWMITRDLPAVLAMDEESFEHPWPEEIFRLNLRARHCVGMVAEKNDRILGFMVYELHKSLIYMLRSAVQCGERQRGIGSAQVQKLYRRLHGFRRRRLLLPVPDDNLFSYPTFFKKQQLHAVATIPYSDGDGHLLEHCVGRATDTIRSHTGSHERSIESVSPPNAFLPIQRWKPRDISAWDPKTLKENDPYGLWSNGEDEEGE